MQLHRRSHAIPNATLQSVSFCAIWPGVGCAIGCGEVGRTFLNAATLWLAARDTVHRLPVQHLCAVAQALTGCVAHYPYPDWLCPSSPASYTAIAALDDGGLHSSTYSSCQGGLHCVAQHHEWTQQLMFVMCRCCCSCYHSSLPHHDS